MPASFKTEKGTELPLRNLKGSEYLEVKWRLVWFREEHPDWSIETEFTVLADTYSLAKATIKDAAGRVRATAHKREDTAHFSDANEKSETGAIGRALALCGYGTQFAEELDEQHRIVDAPVSRTPRGPAPAQALNERLGLVSPAAPKPVAPVAPAGNLNRQELNAKVMALHPEYSARFGNDLISYMQLRWNVDETRLLSVEQLEELRAYMAHRLRSQPDPAAEAQPENSLGAYIVKANIFYAKGKSLKGQRLDSIDKPTLEAAMKESFNWYTTNKKNPNKDTQEFFTVAQDYLYGPTPAPSSDAI